MVWRLLAVGSSLLDPRLPRPGARDAVPSCLSSSWSSFRRCMRATRPRSRVRPRTRSSSNQSRSPSGRRSRPSPIRATWSRRRPVPEPSPRVALRDPDRPARQRPAHRCRCGGGRSTFLTDTMIVASLDPVAGAVSMVSVPRDIVDVPLADGRITAARSTASSRTRATRRNSRARDGAGFDVLIARSATLLEHRDPGLGAGQPRRVRARHRHDRRHRHNVPAISATRLRRIRLQERRLVHGRQAPPQRRPGAGIRPGPQGAGENDFTRAARQQEVAAGTAMSSRAASSTIRSGAQGDGRPSRPTTRPRSPRTADEASHDQARPDLPGGHRPTRSSGGRTTRAARSWSPRCAIRDLAAGVPGGRDAPDGSSRSPENTPARTAAAA